MNANAITVIGALLAASLVSISPALGQEPAPPGDMPKVETQPPAKGEQPVLEEVASFPKQQVTGVAVSKEGRVFVNFPFWSDDHTTSVAEVGQNGALKPFPNDAWQAKEGDPAKRWVCVQSVFVDDSSALWV